MVSTKRGSSKRVIDFLVDGDISLADGNILLGRWLYITGQMVIYYWVDSDISLHGQMVINWADSVLLLGRL